MDTPLDAQQTRSPESEDGEGIPAHPRTDLFGACGWIVLGGGIFWGGFIMDRLENQHINPYTIPGLLPMLLGIGMMLIGTMMGLRSLGQGALVLPAPPPPADVRAGLVRLGTVAALCLAFTLSVGRGVPFWFVAGAFVTVSIFVLQWGGRRAESPGAASATLAGIGLLATLIMSVSIYGLFSLTGQLFWGGLIALLVACSALLYGTGTSSRQVGLSAPYAVRTVVTGFLSAALIAAVFEQMFLVRMP